MRGKADGFGDEPVYESGWQQISVSSWPIAGYKIYKTFFLFERTLGRQRLFRQPYSLHHRLW
ncbi:MAG: hypothetical protein AABZ02_13575, partial [Bacteroidota bacterium]